MKDAFEATTKLFETYADVTDEASAKKAAEKIKDMHEEMKDLAVRMKAVGNPSKEEMKELMEKLKPEIEEFQKTMMKSMGVIEHGQEVTKILDGAMDEIGKIMDGMEGFMPSMN
ncbi:MAG: methyl-accepting chemotaxis protein [Verrucomicrobiales bacterium]|jgi:methyl-accepting chemotaxis protein